MLSKTTRTLPDSPTLQIDPDAEVSLAPILILPPNFASAIVRSGTAMIKLEIRVDGDSVSPEKLNRRRSYRASDGSARVLWLLQSWCSKWPGSLLQLSTEQLKSLWEATSDTPVFYRHGESDPVTADSPEILLVHQRVQSLHLENSQETPPERSTRTVKRQQESEGIPGTIDGSEHFLAIQLPSKDHPAYAPVRDRVQADRFKLEPSNRKWWLRDRERVLKFLAEYGQDIESTWGLQPTANFRKQTRRIHYLEPSIQIDQARGSKAGFTVAVGWQGVSDETVTQAVARGASRIENENGIFLASSDQVERVNKLKQSLRSCGSQTDLNRIHIRRETLTAVDDLLEDWTEYARVTREWKESVERLRNPDSMDLPDLPNGLADRLRPYQRLGTGWFWNLHKQGLGGILADEMGLGKTIQSLALLSCLHRSKRPALVVCPASLVENWVREAREFAPGLRPHKYQGIHRSLSFKDLSGSDLIVTSYGTMRADRALFLKTDFSVIIGDEAQHFKNSSTETAWVMQQLRAESRFALTGTPIENAVSDLEGIGSFALPGVFRGRSSGNDRPGTILDRIRPYLLRRTKAEVLRDLPKKWESRRFVELSGEQQRIYDDIRRRTEQRLFQIRSTGGSGKRIVTELWTELLRLRQATAEPRILDSSLPRSSSSKAEGLLELIQEACESGSRVLVFSQFTQTLQWLRADFEEERIPFCYLDGSTRNRQELVDQFNNNGDIPVFLLSLKAGGTGLNLTGADTVVHYDPWWNPAVEAQATDRAHRIGQTRKVQSIKLIGAGTVEEKVLQLQEEKRALLGDLFEKGRQSVMDWDTLTTLLSAG